MFALALAGAVVMVVEEAPVGVWGLLSFGCVQAPRVANHGPEEGTSADKLPFHPTLSRMPMHF